MYVCFELRKGPLTIWPVYAYTLDSQNTAIKLPMLILYTEDNSSMSYEEIRVQIFTYSVIILKTFTLQWGRASKFHEYKKVEIFFLPVDVCVLKHSVDRNTQEPCKTHKNV